MTGSIVNDQVRGTMKGRYARIFFLLIIVISLSWGTYGPGETQAVDLSDLETSQIWGFVVDEEGTPLSNYTVRIDTALFQGKDVRSDRDGHYLINTSGGSYELLVITPGGQIVWRIAFDVADGEKRHFDFSIDTDAPVRSTFSGSVTDRFGDGLSGCTVLLSRESPITVKTTKTSENGTYTLSALAGTYNLTISRGDTILHTDVITLVWGEDRSYDLETGEGEEKPFINMEDIWSFLNDHWIDILVLILILAGITILYGVLMRLITRARSKEGSIFGTEWFKGSENLLRRVTFVGVIFVITGQIAKMSPYIDENIWTLVKQAAGPIMMIVLIMFLTRVMLFGNTTLWERIRRAQKDKKKGILPAQLLTLLETVTRYLVILTSGLLIFTLILLALGLSKEITDLILDFLKKSAGELVFLIILVVIAILSHKFIEVFFNEVEGRTKPETLQLVQMGKKGVKGMVYLVIGLIVLFTALSMGGMADIGQTFILVISMIIGFVISFAATGSIGNLLSGLVLMSIKPFDIGDRVLVGTDIVGDVQNSGMMFTTIRDLEGEIIEVPNNIVLATSIVNYSRSAREGGFTVVIDVSLGYDINPKKARELMKESALSAHGVLKDPSPFVLITRFLDHAVEYRVKAYIDRPQSMLHIRTAVMEQMLLTFHRSGLEILSPLYHVKREESSPPPGELMDRADLKVEESAVEGLHIFDQIDVEN